MSPEGARTRAAVALGGNVGDVAAAFRVALQSVTTDGSCRVTEVSSLYRSKAWGVEDQDDFLNAVCCIETDLPPIALLERLLREERAAGRVRADRWGPRVLDLDLLWYGREMMDTPRLRIPHPGLARRSFVLAPAREVAPFWTDPVGGESLDRMTDRLRASGEWTRCDPVASAEEWCAELLAGVACRS